VDKRILLLVTDLQIGGTPTVVRELAVRLDKQPGVWVEVACLDRWGPVADQLRDRGIAVEALAARGRADVSVVFRLAKLIGQHRIDTVLSFLAHANAAAAAASLLCAKTNAVFLQSIQTTQPQPRWHWQIQRAAQRAARKIVVPSASVARVAAKWAGIAAGKIVVIPNAVEVREFSDLLRRKRSGHRVGFIGRLDPIKRIGDLIEAMGKLDAEATLDIFGAGGERDNLEALIGRLGLGSRVRLKGAVSGPRDALRDIDLLVLPSEAEGFGLVLIEAMAAGVPVVGTNVPGICDVIEDGGNGMLVPVGKSAAIAGAIQKIFSTAELRDRLVAGGLASVREKYTWQRVLPQYLHVLGIG
jgi:glycosyltransferase involved in cell wall biosynthesis